MEQQDHIATLCAASTLGIAATGLALGVQAGSDHAYAITPGKRKWPGASSLKSDNTPHPLTTSRRAVSQPPISSTPAVQDKVESFRSSSLFRRQSKRDVLPNVANDSDVTGSRGSSLNRNSLLRPRTADTRSTSEKREPSTNSSWLKRISIVSTPRASSPSVQSSNLDSTPQSMTSSQSDAKLPSPPNKLVKRSLSQRILSGDQANGIYLRRPATSHQRSATVQEWIPRETSYSTPATPYLTSDNAPAWRPYFERGYSRKRHVAVGLKESVGPRTISASVLQQPILMLGSQIDSLESPDDHVEKAPESIANPKNISTSRQRLKRSLSSVHRAARRRHFTDPIVKVTPEAVNGTITSTVRPFSVSTGPHSSPYLDLSEATPSFSSSPPMIPARNRFSFRKRQSTAPSDPTTIGSDNETRIFTDDDSMEFQSDTAYDSLNTRATVSSHSAFRNQKLDGVFNEPQALHSGGAEATLANLMRNTTLSDNMIYTYSHLESDQPRDRDIHEIEEEDDKIGLTDEPTNVVTPVKSHDGNDYNTTPVAHRLQYFELPLRSSPPMLAPATVNTDVGTPEFVLHQRRVDDDDDDDDNIDWSPKPDKKENTSTSTLRQNTLVDADPAPVSPTTTHSDQDLSFIDEEENDGDKRLSSIFDWSENQKFSNDGIGGALIRPKTVHGKQGHDGSRSRSSGRKGQSQMHLRSQSVPTNRDPSAEPTPSSASKFGTWGLGHKPVSEEWNDDFEFDDGDEECSPQLSSEFLKPGNRNTLRGVKVPQAIIDRQASVHLQFGQVQEFMLLVEELKTLRSRGAALQLLETHSKQLWEDAESIIDLATINNEDDDNFVRPESPTPSDFFEDEIPIVSRSGPDRSAADESRRNSIAPRSVSNPATPPHGRPRGESLALAKNFLQSIHQSRSGFDSSPLAIDREPQRKLPFDTQDLKDLVVRSGVITRALKEIIRKAEGLSVSPSKTPPKSCEPAFSQIFNAPDASPCPPFRKPGLPKSQSANSYLVERYNSGTNHVPTSPTPMALALSL